MSTRSEAEKSEIKKAFLYQLSEVIFLEHELYKTFQEVTDQAHCVDLKLALKEHEEEIANQHKRLKDIAMLIDLPSSNTTSWPVFAVFSLELNEIIKEHYNDPKVRDLVLIAFSRKVKSYEIACYQNLKYLASLLDLGSVHQLLLESFDEKQETRALLEELSQECYKNPVMYPRFGD
ncbi:MAG: DUF892 family protein [Mucilaginibacter polytrichastri]|nr:DUF892 family protein [Mucilaginibacter polytrichastri]